MTAILTIIIATITITCTWHHFVVVGESTVRQLGNRKTYIPAAMSAQTSIKVTRASAVIVVVSGSSVEAAFDNFNRHNFEFKILVPGTVQSW